jgi:tRNA threonylcarbamoyladenosine biosynthesis protein TsaB
MNPLLAIETSTRVGSVALGRGGVVLGEVLVGEAARHSEVLLPAVEFLLTSARLSTRELGGIVVGAGPGSFTGVRLAAATARGLTRALEVPLSAWSSLAAAAAGAARADGTPVCALFDARRGEVYAGCYRFPGLSRCETVLAPTTGRVEEIVERVRGHAPLWTGDGALRYADQLPEAPSLPAPLQAPRASALLWLESIGAGRGRVAEPADWEPDYQRAPGAERGGPA